MRRDRARTEASIGVLSLDTFTPILAEEHVRGQGALGRVLVLLALAAAAALLLVGGLALWTKSVSARSS